MEFISDDDASHLERWLSSLARTGDCGDVEAPSTSPVAGAVTSPAAVVVAGVSGSKESLLHVACRLGAVECVQLLLRRGSDVNSVSAHGLTVRGPVC